MSEETKTQPTTTETQSTITLNDFILIQNIISVAAKRGAFESKEFTVIGNLTDRLNIFITENSPVQEETSVTEQLELPLAAAV
jgi:hypothetical protein